MTRGNGEGIDTPALVIDLELLEGNIEKMADFFRGREAGLRPHIKTHKCPEIASMQLEAGAKGITCAKLGEAEAMAGKGIGDILIANEIVGRIKIERLLKLMDACDAIVAIDNASNAQIMSDMASMAGKRVGVLVEVDVGMGRCGVSPGEEALALARRIGGMRGLEMKGIMGYEGHAVMIQDFEARRRECLKAMGQLLGTRSAMEREGMEVEVVSAGGTGTYRITGAHPGISEVQAGSYATMDTRYKGIVPEFECAIGIMTTVISRPAANRAIVDAGMKSVTAEFGLPIVRGREDIKVVKLNEEHGILSLEGSEKPSLGDRMELLPSHGCTTFNLHDKIYALRKGAVESIWEIAARGRST
jgi:D-serine deaminase-like pyridoxal phosphate-dependent protein